MTAITGTSAALGSTSALSLLPASDTETASTSSGKDASSTAKAGDAKGASGGGDASGGSTATTTTVAQNANGTETTTTLDAKGQVISVVTSGEPNTSDRSASGAKGDQGSLLNLTT